MALISVTTPERTLDIVTAAPIPFFGGAVLQIVNAMDDMNKIVPISNFEFSRPNEAATSFDYHITLKDGREWQQTIFIGPPIKMTFDVTDQWALSEFVPHRSVRDALTQNMLALRLISFECTYV